MGEMKLTKLIFNIILICFLTLVLIGDYSTVYAGGWFEGAQDFMNSADSNITINSTELNRPSSEVYNILTSLGMIIAVVVGIDLGIKYMIAGADEKAEVKETLLPYIIGCVVTFGAFGIWRILINTFIGIS